jgi:hypothetical protein
MTATVPIQSAVGSQQSAVHAVTPSPRHPVTPSPPGGTSAAAGQIAARSVSTRYAQIVDHIRTRGPSAIFEIASALGVFDHQISGRFSELTKRGIIRATGQSRIKPDTGAQAELYDLAEARQLPACQRLPEALGYPPELRIPQAAGPGDDGIYIRQAMADDSAQTMDCAPGVPYARRADRGVRLQVRVFLIRCPGCGGVLRQSVESGTKLTRCSSEGCPGAKGWTLQLVTESGQAPIPALILRRL